MRTVSLASEGSKPRANPGVHTQCAHVHPSVDTICLGLHLRRPRRLLVLKPPLGTWVLNESTARRHMGLWTLQTSVCMHVVCMHPQILDSL